MIIPSNNGSASKTVSGGLYEFLVFGLKQVRACVFAGSFFLILYLSNYLNIFDIPRYDFIFLASLLLQAILVLIKIETVDELKTICLFHIIGLALEIFKTNPAINSWSYPEAGYFKIFNVPLYSGFMYAAVASYMIQSWRLLKLRLINYPRYHLSLPVAILVYVNFFTHHFIPDLRWFLKACILTIFIRTKIGFTVIDKERSMPVVLAFFLIGFFIWIAENISTYLGAWKYPNQQHDWEMVSMQKISSWSLLVIISFIIVAHLKHARAQRLV